ncbi:hypothetical protein ABZ897_54045 [Nonomuraea sp. NPDC046802]|uniref:hypothetical protein n=1 Tax=Nonomuraea sp. NPDC046802 TaxID=3154919 RepID=UPI0034096F3E
MDELTATPDVGVGTTEPIATGIGVARRWAKAALCRMSASISQSLNEGEGACDLCLQHVESAKCLVCGWCSSRVIDDPDLIADPFSRLADGVQHSRQRDAVLASSVVTKDQSSNSWS